MQVPAEVTSPWDCRSSVRDDACILQGNQPLTRVVLERLGANIWTCARLRTGEDSGLRSVSRYLQTSAIPMPSAWKGPVADRPLRRNGWRKAAVKQPTPLLPFDSRHVSSETCRSFTALKLDVKWVLALKLAGAASNIHHVCLLC